MSDRRHACTGKVIEGALNNMWSGYSTYCGSPLTGCLAEEDITSPNSTTEPEPIMKQDLEHFPEAHFFLEPEHIAESVSRQTACHKGYFNGMDWSPTHTAFAEFHAMSWVPAELLLFYELDDEMFQGLQLQLVPPSLKSPSSPMVPPSFPLLPPLPTPFCSLALPPLDPFVPLAHPSVSPSNCFV